MYCKNNQLNWVFIIMFGPAINFYETKSNVWVQAYQNRNLQVHCKHQCKHQQSVDHMLVNTSRPQKWGTDRMMEKLTTCNLPVEKCLILLSWSVTSWQKWFRKADKIMLNRWFLFTIPQLYPPIHTSLPPTKQKFTTPTTIIRGRTGQAKHLKHKAEQLWICDLIEWEQKRRLRQRLKYNTMDRLAKPW